MTVEEDLCQKIDEHLRAIEEKIEDLRKAAGELNEKLKESKTPATARVKSTIERCNGFKLNIPLFSHGKRLTMDDDALETRRKSKEGNDDS